MKQFLWKKLGRAGIEPMEHTMEAFNQLFHATKSGSTHRLRSLYSYDIKDNPEFKKAQAIEKRIRKFYGS